MKQIINSLQAIFFLCPGAVSKDSSLLAREIASGLGSMILPKANHRLGFLSHLRSLLLMLSTLIVGCSPSKTSDEQATKKPNLLVIMTDEHNFRTLGCYRDVLPREQAYVWGDGLAVETPNIDFLAQEGVLFSKFYCVTPSCSPARGSFVSGLYPQHTGVQQNDLPMYDHVATFASVLKENGYATGYAGKWHLDGEGKPQWGPERKFGFEDNRYMFNRGHWKKMVDTPGGPEVATKDSTGNYSYALDGADDKTFATDFLTDKTIEFIEKNKEAPFCYMVSYPDPHGPDTVRPPYDTMYTHMNFEPPATSQKPDDDVPSWASKVEEEVDQSQYFGMVKCIDDNVGRLVKTLEEHDLLDNTIIIFTSDHGDLRGEHYRRNKGVPLEASAKVPFIVYAKSMDHKGTKVSHVFNSVDFAPTLLSYMGLEKQESMEGIDFSALLHDPSKQTDLEDFTVIRSSNKNNLWIAGATSRYKLVLSEQDPSWLLDLQENPGETINYIEVPGKRKVVKDLAQRLKTYALERKDPFLQNTEMEKEMLKLCED